MIDVYTTSSRAMEILADIADPGLLRALGKFSDVTCHLVSSTDCAVNREGKYPRVQPRRVVEPLASILLRLKVL